MNILTGSPIKTKLIRVTVSLGILFLLIAWNYQKTAPAEWQKPLQPSMASGPLTCLAPHPLESEKFLIASQHQVFEGLNGASSWLNLGGQIDPGSTIQKLMTFNTLPNNVFVLTTKKIFMGNLKDRSWQTVFKDADKLPISFALHPKNPNHWFLGTQKGLWESDSAGKTWYRSKIFNRTCSIPLLWFDRDRLFIADESSLYMARSIDPKEIPPAQLVFEIQRKEASLNETDAGSEDLNDVSLYPAKVHDMIRAAKNRSLFLATSEGAFESSDEGYHWTPLSRSGLQSPVILHLAYSEKEERLFAGTPKGVYAFDRRSQRWQKLFEGLAKDRTQSIAVLNEDKLIAITAEGFVQYPLQPFQPEGGQTVTIFQPSRETLSLFKKLTELEPTSREIHQRAIRYANVGNGKIKRWQAASRIAGLLPTLSFSRSFSRSSSIDIDRGGTSEADRYIIGPEDAGRSGYRTLSWDFGDMLYSSDQTSIDSREKLMVELRNDILSEVTRIYYERRRLQIDLIFNPSASEQEHLENLLRLDELTSLLDAMTNGFVSKRLIKIYDDNPEFNQLWAFQEKAAAL